MPSANSTNSSTSNNKSDATVRAELAEFMQGLGMKVPNITADKPKKAPAPAAAAANTNTNNTKNNNKSKSKESKITIPTDKSATIKTVVTAAKDNNNNISNKSKSTVTTDTKLNPTATPVIAAAAAAAAATTVAPSVNSNKKSKKGRKNNKLKPKTDSTGPATATTTASASASSAAVPIHIPSTNKNTLKNKSKRQKAAAAINTINPIDTAKVSESIKTASIQSQQYAESNNKKFAALAIKLTAESNNNNKLWYEQPDAAINNTEYELLKSNTSNNNNIITTELTARIQSYYIRAETLFNNLTAEFQSIESKKATSNSNSDENWIANILLNGTLKDKIACLTISIQSNPIQRLAELQRLLSMANKHANKRQYQLTIESLRDLFIESLLPKTRKLISFNNRPIWRLIDKQYRNKNSKAIKLDSDGNIITNNNNSDNSTTVLEPRDEQLIYWYYEDQLKLLFSNYLLQLETSTHDIFNYIKSMSINTLFSLLNNIIERESQILILICNKLGDTDRSISSTVLYKLNEFLLNNPEMKLPILREIGQLLYRSNISPKTQYYCIIFLNQFLYNNNSLSDSIVAKQALFIYLNLFQLLIKNNKKSLLNSKLLGGLLTGVNRALPYALNRAHSNTDSGNSTEKLLLDQINILFEIVHNSNWPTSIQALMLLYQCIQFQIESKASNNNNNTDNNNDSNNTDSTDDSDKIINRYYRVLYNSLFSIEFLNHSNKPSAMYFNLLYRTMKTDLSLQRTAAFIKRLLINSLNSSTPTVAAILLLINSIIVSKPQLKILFTQSQKSIQALTNNNSNNNNHNSSTSTNSDSEDSETEHFKDVIEADVTTATAAETASAVDSKSTIDSKSTPIKECYDPKKRSPEYSSALFSCVWELNLLCNHYHPTVGLFAKQLLLFNNQSLTQYSGDPLIDFTSTAFLDKFVFKNPKKLSTEQSKTNRAKQLKRANTILNQSQSEQSIEQKLLSASSGANGSTTADIKSDDLFFYQYFIEKARKTNEIAARKQKSTIAASSTDYGDEDSDDYADRIMEAEMRRLAGKADLDEDLDSEWDGIGDEAEIDQDAIEPVDDAELADQGEGEGEWGEEFSDSPDEAEADADDDAEIDSDDEEAAVTGAQSDSEEELDLSDDNDDDGELPDFSEDDSDINEDSEGESSKPIKGNKSKSKSLNPSIASGVGMSVFASADEFADILNTAGEPIENPKFTQWQNKNINHSRNNSGQKRSNNNSNNRARNNNNSNNSNKRARK